MLNVCLMGASLDTGNNGVSALLLSLVRLILEVRPDARISLFIGNRSSQPQELILPGRKVGIGIINYRLSPSAPLKRHLFWILLMACLFRLLPFEKTRKLIMAAAPPLRDLWQADFVGSIRGGDSFTDLYGLRRFISGSIPALVVLLLGKDLVFLPQTYARFRSAIAQGLARFIMVRSAKIFSRDRGGIEIARDIMGRGSREKEIFFCPDVAFILEPRLPEKPEILSGRSRDVHRPLIGFNISGLLYNGGYTRNNMFGLELDYRLFVCKLAEKLLEETDGNILFIPHTYAPDGHVESDPDACHQVLRTLNDSYPDRVYLVAGHQDAPAVKGIIGLCDFFIGSRMHACIAALSQGIPTVGVSYSRKFAGVFSSVAAADLVIDARLADMDSAIDAVCRHFRRREMIGQALKENVQAAEILLRTTFRDLLNDQKEIPAADRAREPEAAIRSVGGISLS